MQLMEYLPLFFKNIREFQWLMSAEQPEMDFIYQGIEDYINDQFYNTLTEAGCKRWEQALGIKALSSQTLEERRLVIKAKANDLPPYTLKVARDLMASIFGDDGYILFEDTEAYTLMLRNLTNDKAKWLSAIDILEKIVPCNIIIDPGLWYRVPFCGEIKCGTYWKQSTLGYSDNRNMEYDNIINAFAYDTEKAGTLPDISTLGDSEENNIAFSKMLDAIKYNVDNTGEENAGTHPNITTLGFARAPGNIQFDSGLNSLTSSPNFSGMMYCGSN